MAIHIPNIPKFLSTSKPRQQWGGGATATLTSRARLSCFCNARFGRHFGCRPEREKSASGKNVGNSRGAEKMQSCKKACSSCRVRFLLCQQSRRKNCQTVSTVLGRVGRTMLVSRIANEFHIRVASFFRAPARTDYKGGTNPNCFPYCQRVSYNVITTGPFLRRLWWHIKNVHGTTCLLFCNFAFPAPREFPPFFPDAGFSGFRPAPEMSPKTRVAETA